MKVLRRVFAAATFGLLLTVFPETVRADSPIVDAIPVAYYVAASRHELRETMRRLREEEDPPYDQQVRWPEPYGPPIVVNCKTTRWLGVLLHVEIVEPRSPDQPEVPIRYVWEHPEVEPDSGYFDEHRELDYYAVGRAFDEAFLKLGKALRVDGLISFTASVEGEQILEASFKLEGCSDPD